MERGGRRGIVARRWAEPGGSGGGAGRAGGRCAGLSVKERQLSTRPDPRYSGFEASNSEAAHLTFSAFAVLYPTRLSRMAFALGVVPVGPNTVRFAPPDIEDGERRGGGEACEDRGH